MTRTLHRISLLATGLMLAATAQAQSYGSQLLAFDELPKPAFAANLPDGYGGFDWSSSYYYMTNEVTGNKYLAMGSSNGTYWRHSDGTPFYFDGIDLWSRRGLDAVGDVYFVLYLKGKTVYNGLTDKKGGRIRFTGAPTMIRPNYTGLVDYVALAFDSNGKDWNHLALDNLRVRVASPAK
ncbi:hypothetical protein J7U46_02360 [Pelomonas sp. V22]|uniref:hypothetical protein n=1 Tax=Pelomonas sp. V22 TaxID=2822139 RepID=UPI0024A9BDB2|nr:hypothetical protein [Pelomonas sp. V22]MDI4631883.1 hypothetical protein [Pelomonas sp. V22]